MAAKKLRVELLVCPEPGCRHVGKKPLGDAMSIKGYCTGPSSATHRRRRMEPVRFVEERG